jgi:hypothetical protein
MERRDSSRLRYRLPTEIVCAGTRQHGFVVDVSRTGAFVQTPRTIEPGSEIELWFADDQLAPQVARARVVPRRSVPPSSVVRAGIAVEWIHAPQFARELDDCGIEVVIDASADGEANALPPGSQAPAEKVAPAEMPAAAGDAANAAPAEKRASGAATNAAPPAPIPTIEPVVAGEIVAVEPGSVLEQTVELGPTAVSAEVALIDEGDLGEIEQLARTLGARTLRMRWGAQAEPVVWEAPPRLVVVSARVALAVPLGDAALCRGALGVAVCDSEASTLRAQLRRQGYELVVHRGAHPETLRLLFASLLWQHHERRKQRRRAFGARVSFWRGFRRLRGTLLDLSPGGASLLLARALPERTRLTVRLPAKHAGGRTLALPCEAVRAAPSAHGAIVGLRFAALPARKQKRLAAVIRELEASGPLPVPRSLGGDRAEQGERRSGARVRLAQRALALDPVTHVARDVLFGTDLSMGGMRVEPHPRLTRGAQLLLALQPPGGGPPVTVRAQVARDDGERGLVLRFTSLAGAARDAVQAMLDTAAEVERTSGAQGERVVLGSLLEAQPAG